MGQNRRCQCCLMPATLFFSGQSAFIQELITSISNCGNFSAQQRAVKICAEILGGPIRSDDQRTLFKVLVFMLLSSNPTTPIRKSISRILEQFKRLNLLRQEFSASMKILIPHCDTIAKERRREYRDLLMTSMNGTMCDFEGAVAALNRNAELVFGFMINFFAELVDYIWQIEAVVDKEFEDFRTYIYNTVKFALNFVQKCTCTEVKLADRLKLISYCYEVMKHSHIPYEIKSNCGHIIVIVFTSLPEDLLVDSIYKDRPYFELLMYGTGKSAVLAQCGIVEIEDDTLCKMIKICMYNGILNVTTPEILCQYTVCNTKVLPYMLVEFIELANQAKGNLHVLGAAKGISVLSSYLKFLSLEEVRVLYNKVLNYILVYLDDRLDLVKNYTKKTFENLVIRATDEQAAGKDELLGVISEWLLKLPLCNSRYIGVSVVATLVSCKFILKKIPDIAKQLIGEIKIVSTSSNIIACYEVLMTKHLNEVHCINGWIDYWVNEIIVAMKTSEEPISILLQDLFLSAVKIDVNALKALTHQLYLETCSELGALLKCIHYARNKGLRFPIEVLYCKLVDTKKVWQNLLEYRTLEILQTHQNENIRKLVLEIIVDSQKTTEAFTEWETKFIITYLKYNLNTSNTSMRQHIITLTKRALTRVNQSDGSIRKRMLTQGINEASFDYALAILYYPKFWSALFTDVLLPGLTPGCNYGRRTACLELLRFIVSTIPLTQFFDKWDIHCVKHLKHIVEFDTYERNKELAANLLDLFTLDQLGLSTAEAVDSHIEHCSNLALSIKPVQTISAAYMLRPCLRSPHLYTVILNKLDKNSKLRDLYVHDPKDPLFVLLIHLYLELLRCHVTGKLNLQEAVATRPIHGFMFCIRYLLKTETLTERKIEMHKLKEVFKKIIDVCFMLNELVKPIICNPSPEGYLPEDPNFDLAKTDETAQAQMLTVYAWRAVKEISLFFGDLALKAPISEDKDIVGILDGKQLSEIGEYYYHLLLSIKHRGAFEQAAVGFRNLCYKMWRLTKPSVNTYPQVWMKLLVGCIAENKLRDEVGDICATRRSAGIPFMVQALMTTEPDGNANRFFHFFMSGLLMLCGDLTKPEQSRIHALNVVRGLYRHNQCGELVIGYCGQGVIVAIDGYASSSWAIRNSSTLLFSALIVRMFGVQRTRGIEELCIKNKMATQVFFVRYPELYKYLLNSLATSIEEEKHFVIYPILLILSRLYCSEGTPPAYQLGEFFLHIWASLNNPTYRIRELAAKTFIGVLQPHEILHHLVSVLINLSIAGNPNAFCHGNLLMFHHLLKSINYKLPVNLNVDKIIDGTGWILLCSNIHISHFTATLYLEVITDMIIHSDPEYRNCKVFEKVLLILKWIESQKCDNENLVSTAMKKYRICMFNLKLCLFLHMLRCSHCQKGVDLLSSFDKDLRSHSELRNLCISYLDYLKFSTTDYNVYYDFYEDDSEHSEHVNKFLRHLNVMYKKLLYNIFLKTLRKVICSGEDDIQMQADSFFLELFMLLNVDRKRKDKKQLLQHYVSFCHDSYSEQTVFSAITLIDNFLQEMTNSELSRIKLDVLACKILKYSSPTYDGIFRLAISKLLVNNKRIFYQERKDNLFIPNNLYIVWEAVLVLLEDDDEEIRDTISQLCQESLIAPENNYAFLPRTRLDISEYSREIILNTMLTVCSETHSVILLLSWMLRSKDGVHNNLSEVFDEGEVNTYTEPYSIAKTAVRLLHNMLWKVESPNKRIPIREQAKRITAMLYNKFVQKHVPLVGKEMNEIICNVLQRVAAFLRDASLNEADLKRNLKRVFHTAFASKIMGKLDASELVRLKMFCEEVYKDALC